jgi:hypothetical protein
MSVTKKNDPSKQGKHRMGAKLAKLTLNPENQNLEHIQRIVAGIVERAGCGHCGRLLRLDLEFLGDPADLKKIAGVISAETVGF